MVVGVGPFNFHLYGLLIALGIVVGSLVASRVAKVKLDDVFDFFVWPIGFGLVGARAYHVIDLWSYYSVHLNEIVMVWRGGMGIFGGILGGVVGAWIYLLFSGPSTDSSPSRSGLKGVPSRTDLYKKILDVGAIGLPIAQSIGRWGNYFNQELYGKPTDLPWGIFIRPENRLIEVIDFERFHPLFLYESVLCLVIFFVLWGLVRFKKVKIGEGRLFVFYLGLYGLVRFFLEFLRIEAWTVGGFNVAQMVSIVLVIVSGTSWVKRLMR